MPALATPDTIAGPLTAADLDAARQVNPGSIWHPHRHIMAAGLDQQGRHPTREWHDTVPVQPQAAECCTELGAESMLRHRRTAAHTKSIALALLLAVAGYLAHITWPLA
jgi:hypothetical protein